MLCLGRENPHSVSPDPHNPRTSWSALEEPRTSVKIPLPGPLQAHRHLHDPMLSPGRSPSSPTTSLPWRRVKRWCRQILKLGESRPSHERQPPKHRKRSLTGLRKCVNTERQDDTPTGRGISGYTSGDISSTSSTWLRPQNIQGVDSTP